MKSVGLEVIMLTNSHRDVIWHLRTQGAPFYYTGYVGRNTVKIVFYQDVQEQIHTFLRRNHCVRAT